MGSRARWSCSKNAMEITQTPVAVLLIVCGLAILTLGAELLVRGGASLALRLGVTPLVIGLTIVAFGTGAPEFVVSLDAAIKGSSGIALGNVIGSNIANLALILGIAAIVRPMSVKAEILRREMPVLMVVTAVVCIMLYDGQLDRIDGILLVGGGVAYTAGAYYLSRRRESTEVEDEFGAAVGELAEGGKKRRAITDVVLLLIGLAALAAGANLLVTGAVSVARAAGLTEAVIGLTIVAIGTSLPELATSVVAAYRGESDISFGNAIGSNVFNILMVLGIAAVITPIPTDGIRLLDIAVFIGSVVIVWAMLGRRFLLARPEGALLTFGYSAYMYSLFQ